MWCIKFVGLRLLHDETIRKSKRYPYLKVKSKWNKDLKVKYLINCRVLEENITLVLG